MWGSKPQGCSYSSAPQMSRSHSQPHMPPLVHVTVFSTLETVRRHTSRPQSAVQEGGQVPGCLLDKSCLLTGFLVKARKAPCGRTSGKMPMKKPSVVAMRLPNVPKTVQSDSICLLTSELGKSTQCPPVWALIYGFLLCIQHTLPE